MDAETEAFVADQRPSRGVRGTGIAILVAMAAAAVPIYLTRPSSGWAEAVVTALALLLGAGAGVLLLVCRITVTVGPRAVSLAFWPVYRQRLAVTDLVSVRDVPRVTPSMFGGGSGLRFASGNRVALLFGAGAATEITTTTGRTYTVVVADPVALTAAVEQLIGRNA